MTKKIRVLFYTELWANAGIESVIMSYFRNFDLNKIQVDIMASQNITDFYDDEIRQLGGRKIITLTERFSNPAQRMVANQKAFMRELSENEYDVVHIHMCNAAAMVYGRIAKKSGVPVIVFHSHNTNLGSSHRFAKTLVHNVSKRLFERYGDLLFSCSDLASQWMYTKKAIMSGKVKILNNAIDLEKFAFNEVCRVKMRKEMKLEGKLVVGHIGRFQETKNQSFLIDVFDELHRECQESKLLLIGEGEDLSDMKDKAKEKGLEDAVIFYGTTKKIPEMLWAMDVFVLPSLYEGNPVVGIEAQAASIPCIFSDAITRMCNVSGNVTYVSLKKTAKEWAEVVKKAVAGGRCDTTETMRRAGYDIKRVARDLEDWYFQAIQKSNLIS